MTRPIELLIHQTALTANLAHFKQQAQQQKIFAVVKANAYGHGIEVAYQSFAAAEGLATLELASAKRLRELGWNKPILLLEGVFEPSELEFCRRYALWQVVHADYQIKWLQQLASAAGHKVFVKLNTGMNRLGFTAQQLPAAVAQLQQIKHLPPLAFISHFSDADRADAEQLNSSAQQQNQAFTTALLKQDGEKTLCNSIASLKGWYTRSDYASDWLRLGYALYGGSPDYPIHTIETWRLQPTMTLAAKIIAVQHLTAGQTVGYGSIFTARQNMRIGTVACGYADGYPRAAANLAPVLINGKRSKVLGQVSMDMLTVDLTDIAEADVGSWVTLWGRDKVLYEQALSQQTSLDRVPFISIDEVAYCAQSIGYELMCQIAARVPRKIVR